MFRNIKGIGMLEVLMSAGALAGLGLLTASQIQNTQTGMNRATAGGKAENHVQMIRLVLSDPKRCASSLIYEPGTALDIIKDLKSKLQSAQVNPALMEDQSESVSHVIIAESRNVIAHSGEINNGQKLAHIYMTPMSAPTGTGDGRFQTLAKLRFEFTEASASSTTPPRSVSIGLNLFTDTDKGVQPVTSCKAINDPEPMNCDMLSFVYDPTALSRCFPKAFYIAPDSDGLKRLATSTDPNISLENSLGLAVLGQSKVIARKGKSALFQVNKLDDGPGGALVEIQNGSATKSDSSLKILSTGAGSGDSSALVYSLNESGISNISSIRQTNNSAVTGTFSLIESQFSGPATGSSFFKSSVISDDPTSSGSMVFYRSKGAVSAPKEIFGVPNLSLGSIDFEGRTNTLFAEPIAAAKIHAHTSGSWAVGSNPTQIDFETTPVGSTGADRKPALSILPDGSTQIHRGALTLGGPNGTGRLETYSKGSITANFILDSSALGAPAPGKVLTSTDSSGTLAWKDPSPVKVYGRVEWESTIKEDSGETRMRCISNSGEGICTEQVPSSHHGAMMNCSDPSHLIQTYLKWSAQGVWLGNGTYDSADTGWVTYHYVGVCVSNP